jgi:hypothetical protein
MLSVMSGGMGSLLRAVLSVSMSSVWKLPKGGVIERGLAGVSYVCDDAVRDGTGTGISCRQSKGEQQGK